jgi:hypothetical protein
MGLSFTNGLSARWSCLGSLMFYGAYSASVRDPFGHIWVLLVWKEDLEPAEMERRGKALLSS